MTTYDEAREEQRDRIWKAMFENACGDPDCEAFRVEAAITVLTGGSTHRVYADLVNRAARKRPLFSLPLSPEALSDIRERFAALPLGDDLREGGLMLCEMLATVSAEKKAAQG
jgi:hypothetical protein